MEKKLQVAILGCGRIAERHAIQVKKIGNLIACCDTVEEKADEFGQTHSCKAFHNLSDLLNAKLPIDVVSICTPNGFHAQNAIDCLNAGYNVLCEKPMSISTADGGEMMHAAEVNNKRLFVIKQNRFNPPVSTLKQLISDGKLGKIFSVQLNCFWNRSKDYYQNSWKGTIDLDGGTLYTQFSHFIDLLYWLLGDVKDIEAYGENFNHSDDIEFEDTGVVILRFKSGVLGTINYTVNSYNQNMEGSITVFGENGTVKIGGQYLNELEYQNIKGLEISDLPKGNTSNNYGKYQGSMSNHDHVYQNLKEVMLNGKSISTTAFEGLKTVEIIERIYEKIRTK